jgi:uncharacterized membrane protein YphA (DoxX/SURF4 family)
MFSTFPNGLPGCGLLVLRLAAGIPLLASGISVAWGSPVSTVPAIFVAGGAVGVFLIVGFWTPVAATIDVLFEVWLAWSGSASQTDPALRSLIGVSLAMLGPGYWSTDAWLYGSKLIDVSRSPPGQ